MSASMTTASLMMVPQTSRGEASPAQGFEVCHLQPLVISSTQVKLRLPHPLFQSHFPLEKSSEAKGKRACFRQKQLERASLLLKQSSGGVVRI